ncbi:MAG: hypothetical protein IJF58_05070 [Clostridia bacterium]|nr:hypothetical protein [Clostridia bacterium]
MKLIQRIGDNVELVDFLLNTLDKYPNSFTNVWLNTAYGYPAQSVHYETAEHFAEYAKKFREKGVTVSLQLSNTLGHGQYMMTRDCSGLVYEGSPVKRMVGANGCTAEYGFCWNDDFFKNYLADHVRYYVEKVQPAEIWIDDDLRARNHAPVDFGCFCDDCLATFNAMHGYNYNREDLVNEFLHGDINVRDNWIKFVRKGMSGLAEVIAKATHEGCADTVVCLQNGYNGGYTGYGHDYLFDTMYKATGHAPMYRAGGGAYHAHNPNEMLDKAVQIAFDHSRLPDYVVERCPEIESTPDTAFGKVARGHAFETAAYLAVGATGMSYAMLGALPEKPEFFHKSFKLFDEQRGYYEQLGDLSRKSIAGGMTFATSKKAHLRKLPEDATFGSSFNYNSEEYECANFMLRNGFAMNYENENSGIFLLHPNAARQMQYDELESLTKKNVLTDADTVMYLKSIGIDLGVEARALSSDEGMASSENFTNHKLNKGYRSVFTASFFSGGLANYYTITKVPENAEILGTYKIKFPEVTYNLPDAPHGYTSVIIHNAQGGNWAIMGYGLWKSVIPSFQRDRLLNIIDYISGDAPAVRPISATQDVYLPRVCKETGKTLAVSVINCTIEPQDDVEIIIRNPKSDKFRFMSQYDGEKELVANKVGNDYIIKLPEITPWSVATVFCD